MNISHFSRPALIILGLALLLGSCKPLSKVSIQGQAYDTEASRLIDSYDTFREALRAEPDIIVSGAFAFHRKVINRSPSSQIRFTMNGKIFPLTLIENESVIPFDEIEKLKVYSGMSGHTLFGDYAGCGIVQIIPVKGSPSPFN